MPAIYDSPSTLTLIPSNPWPSDGEQPVTQARARPKERQIPRDRLLDVAPDREKLFLSTTKIEELRQVLKLRGVNPESHWLYRHRKRANISLKDANPRISTLIRSNGINTVSASQDGHGLSSSKEVHILRRVLSQPALRLDTAPYPSPYNIPVPNTSSSQSQNLDIWSSITLSTSEKLISPRPLGPTHILILHSTAGPSRAFHPALGASVRRRRTGKQSSPLSLSLGNIVEIPINDLLFVLNVPNLTPRVLPPRLHKELPRVVMYVPHLDTFPELVVYMHTQNQAELFRMIVPEWIRDLLHPLPELIGLSGEGCRDDDGADSILTSYVKTNASSSSLSIDSKSIAKAPLQLIGRLIPLPGASSNSSSQSRAPVTPYESHSIRKRMPTEFTRTPITIAAEEIAHAAAARTHCATYDPHSPLFISSSNDEKCTDLDSESSDPIAVCVARLNALRDNLEYIGHFAAESLWYEMDVYREVLIRALSSQARVKRSTDDGLFDE
ncbi:hypothetical protein H0H92_009496 [Tricholoma furcatifolium]|nr:hypothetical protein H0H92_009496 [Tricholoma furcatifolium]